jgi:hypothetical protein
MSVRECDLNPCLAFTGLYNLLFEEKIQSYLTFLNVPQLERQREQTCEQRLSSTTD